MLTPSSSQQSGVGTSASGSEPASPRSARQDPASIALPQSPSPAPDSPKASRPSKTLSQEAVANLASDLIASASNSASNSNSNSNSPPTSFRGMTSTVAELKSALLAKAFIGTSEQGRVPSRPPSPEKSVFKSVTTAAAVSSRPNEIQTVATFSESATHSTQSMDAAIFSPIILSDGTGSTSENEHSSHTTEQTGQVTAKSLNLKQERDILDILDEMKGNHNRSQAERRLESGSGRRIERFEDRDVDGNVFDSFRTSLSPVTEHTEQSTIWSSNSSVATLDRRSSAMQFASQLAKRSLSKSLSSASPTEERPASPTKRPISPALQKRAAMFSSIGPQITVTQTASEKVSILGTSNSMPSLRPRSLPPLKQWVAETAQATAQKAHNNKPSGNYTLHALPKTPSVRSFASNMTDDADVQHFGEVFYADQSGSNIQWHTARAVLLKDALLIAYDDPAPVERKFRLAGCVKVESIRTPLHYAASTIETQLHAFELVWADGRREQLACERATQRVQWLSHILDVIAFSSRASTSVVDSPISRAQPTVDQVDRILAEANQNETIETAPVSKFTEHLSRAFSGQDLNVADSVETLEYQEERQSGESLLLHPKDGRRSASKHSSTSSNRSTPHSSSESVVRYNLADLGSLPGSRLVKGRHPYGQSKRGAWSDADRKSTKSEFVNGPIAGRAVARDLHRLLRSMERQDSLNIAKSGRLEAHLNDIHSQLLSIATRLRAHSDDIYDADNASNADAGQPSPTLADKIDYMLSLCTILKESQDKMGSSVEAKLRAQGMKFGQNLDDLTISTTKGSVGDNSNDNAAMKAATLSRIENLLNTVISKIDRSPEESPERSSGSLTPRADATPPASIQGSPFSGSSPISETAIANEREITRQRLERGPSRPTGKRPAVERSHWSEDTPFPSRRQTNLPSHGNLQARENLPNPPVDGNPSDTINNGATIQSDPRLLAMLEQMHAALDRQTKLTNANTDYQREIGHYLKRFDDYLRSEQSSRSKDWDGVSKSIAGLSETMQALLAPRRTPSARSGNSSKSRQDQANAQTTPSRLPSILRRSRATTPPEDVEDGRVFSVTHTETCLNSSCHPPTRAFKHNNYNQTQTQLVNAQSFHGQRPAATLEVQDQSGIEQNDGASESSVSFGRRPSFGRAKSTAPDEEAGMAFDSLEDAMASLGLPPEAVASSGNFSAPPNVNGPRPMPQQPMQARQSARGDSPMEPEMMTILRSFMASVDEKSKRDEERSRANETRLAEMIAQLKEGSTETRVKAMDLKTAEIQKQQKDDKINELINVLKAKTQEQDNLLKKLAENAAKEKDKEEAAKSSPTAADGQKILDSVREGFTDNIREFKHNLTGEVRKTLEEVAILREQKKTLQNEISELFAFKARHQGGAPDPQRPIPRPTAGPALPTGNNAATGAFGHAGRPAPSFTGAFSGPLGPRPPQRAN